MTPLPPCVVAVFAKPPRAGEAKTRLCPPLTPLEASDLAKAFLVDTWAMVEQLPWAVAVVATTAHAAELPDTEHTWLQGEGDLGARIERIMRRGVASAGAAIAMGADTPGLPASLLESARRALLTHDAVIGRCDDGGFYLLGMTRCPEGLFGNLPWSDAATANATVARLRAAGFNLFELPPWFDVDQVADLERLARLIAEQKVMAPATKHALEVLGLLPNAPF